MSFTRENIVDGVKATPVMGGLAAWLAGVPLNSWAAIAGIAYTVLLIIDKLRQMGAFNAIIRWACLPQKWLGAGRRHWGHPGTPPLPPVIVVDPVPEPEK